MSNYKSYRDECDESEGKSDAAAQRYESKRKEYNPKQMRKRKKEKIRVSEYARLLGIAPASVHDQINAGKLQFELQGETRYVDYPAESLIKYKPVK